MPLTPLKQVNFKIQAKFPLQCVTGDVWSPVADCLHSTYKALGSVFSTTKKLVVNTQIMNDSHRKFFQVFLHPQKFSAAFWSSLANYLLRPTESTSESNTLLNFPQSCYFLMEGIIISTLETTNAYFLSPSVSCHSSSFTNQPEWAVKSQVTPFLNNES